MPILALRAVSVGHGPQDFNRSHASPNPRNEAGFCHVWALFLPTVRMSQLFIQAIQSSLGPVLETEQLMRPTGACLAKAHRLGIGGSCRLHISTPSSAPMGPE